jgi:hypothetical protein
VDGERRLPRDDARDPCEDSRGRDYYPKAERILIFMLREIPETGTVWRPGISTGAVLVLLFILPCSIGLLGGIPLFEVLGFIVSILILQGLAAAAGIGLGFPVDLLLPLLASVAAGIILGIFRVCDLFSGRSRRVARQIERIKDLMERHRALGTYGEFMLIPIMWIPGFGLYGTPTLAWILNWRGLRSVLLMLTGWLIACLFVLTMTVGIRTIL